MYRIFPEHKVILLELKGSLSVDEIMIIVRKASLDDQFDRSFRAVLDNRQLLPNFSAGSLKQILELSSLAIGNVSMQVAVISSSYMRARIVDVVAATLIRGIRVRAFSDVPAAIDWLGVTDNAKDMLLILLEDDSSVASV